MKKCDFCGKEISYMEQYCSDECQEKANNYYEKRERYEKLFSVFCAIFVMMIPIGIFMFAFVKGIATIMVTGSCVILALLVFLLPFPTDNMISKMKIQKAVKVTRYISIGILIFGVAFYIFSVIFKF